MVAPVPGLRDRLPQAAAEGASAAAVARDFECSPGTVKRVARAQGLDLTDGRSFGIWRDWLFREVDALPPLEAVAVLKEAVLSLAPGPESHGRWRAALRGAQPLQCWLFEILWRQRGRVVAYDRLLDALSIMASQPMSRDSLSVHLLRLRRALPAGVRIETVWGCGLRLHVPPGWPEEGKDG